MIGPIVGNVSWRRRRRSIFVVHGFWLGLEFPNRFFPIHRPVFSKTRTDFHRRRLVRFARSRRIRQRPKGGHNSLPVGKVFRVIGAMFDKDVQNRIPFLPICGSITVSRPSQSTRSIVCIQLLEGVHLPYEHHQEGRAHTERNDTSSGTHYCCLSRKSIRSIEREGSFSRDIATAFGKWSVGGNSWWESINLGSDRQT